MRTINFVLKWKANEKNCIKESTWIFLTKLCHYHLSEDVKILCMHCQKRSQQCTEGKNTFLRCENLRVSWDLKLSVIKPLHANLIVDLYNNSKDDKEMTINSSRSAEITEAMMMPRIVQKVENLFKETWL